MYPIDVIQRKNHEAVQAAAEAATKAGKLVMFKFSGLHFIDYDLFDNEEARDAAASVWRNEFPGNRAEYPR